MCSTLARSMWREGRVREALDGEITVDRSDVMRGVGRALINLGSEGRITSADAARVRIAIASSLVTLPPRVEAVIVCRHTHQPDMIWREERDRWSHELTDAALVTVLEKARAAGFAVASEADLLALPDADFVRAETKQPVRLNHFQPFVHQRRRVNRYLCTHVPGRML